MLRKVSCLVPALLIAAAVFAAEPMPQIPLWPNGAPGSEGITEKEIDEPPNAQHGYRKVVNVHNPSITVYLPPREKATGASAIVCPGGGHRQLVFDIEGTEIADWLNRFGVAAFVLKYRLADTPGSPYKVEVHALQDTQRAIRTVRARATEWGIDPQRIGVIGFSAGGALAALVSMHFDAGSPAASDPVDRLSSRPDFAVLVYPGWRPIELAVPKDAPPAFLVCADDDRFHADDTAQFYAALARAKVPAEIHIYARGGHGGGIRDRKGAPMSTWHVRLQEWMADRGFLRKP
jgi:acetyl esterase/lipase